MYMRLQYYHISTHFSHFHKFCDRRKKMNIRILMKPQYYNNCTVLSNTGGTHTWLTPPPGASSQPACLWWGSASGMTIPSSNPPLYWTALQWSQNCLVQPPLSDIPRRLGLCLQQPMTMMSPWFLIYRVWYWSCIKIKFSLTFFLLLLLWL